MIRDRVRTAPPPSPQLFHLWASPPLPEIPYQADSDNEADQFLKDMHSEKQSTVPRAKCSDNKEGHSDLQMASFKNIYEGQSFRQNM